MNNTAKPGPPNPQSGGLKTAFADQEFSALDSLGGKRGIIESAFPTLVFMLLFMFTREVVWASALAVGSVLLLIGIRIFRKEPLTPAISGAVGVILGVIVALRSGDGSGFYLPGLIINAAYAAGLLLSVLLKHPLVGYLAAAFDQRVKHWKQISQARKTYRNATLVYAGLFAAKVLVQAPLYYSNQVDALGVAKLVMGLPAFALVTWVIFLLHQGLIKYLSQQGELAES